MWKPSRDLEKKYADLMVALGAQTDDKGVMIKVNLVDFMWEFHKVKEQLEKCDHYVVSTSEVEVA